MLVLTTMKCFHNYRPGATLNVLSAAGCCIIHWAISYSTMWLFVVLSLSVIFESMQGLSICADLSRNYFTEIPCEIYACWTLESLNGYHNTIRSLSDGIARLHNLLLLNLRCDNFHCPAVLWCIYIVMWYVVCVYVSVCLTKDGSEVRLTGLWMAYMMLTEIYFSLKWIMVKEEDTTRKCTNEDSILITL